MTGGVFNILNSEKGKDDVGGGLALGQRLSIKILSGQSLAGQPQVEMTQWQGNNQEGTM